MTAISNTPWQVLTVENSGLAANHVRDIAQDADGNMWFATYGGGLCCRSAETGEWKTYRAAGGRLVNDFVGAIAVDALGRIWAVCDARKTDGMEYPGGICVIAPDGAGPVYPRQVDEDCIVCLEPDRAGTMWFRVGGLVVSGGVTCCDGLRDGPSRFWASKWLAFDGAAWTPYDGDRAAMAAWYPQRPAHTRLGWQIKGDTVWMLETIQPPPIAPPSAGQTSFAPELAAMMTQMRQMMQMTPGLGSFMNEYTLTAYDGREWKIQAQIPSPFRYGELVVDRRGRKWISLMQLGDLALGGGVACYDGDQWTVFDKTTGLLNNHVQALSADSRGNVWVSHGWGDLCRWDGARWEQFPGGPDGRGGQADLGRCIEDRQGRLWFPSKEGVAVYTERK